MITHQPTLAARSRSDFTALKTTNLAIRHARGLGCKARTTYFRAIHQILQPKSHKPMGGLKYSNGGGAERSCFIGSWWKRRRRVVPRELARKTTGPWANYVSNHWGGLALYNRETIYCKERKKSYVFMKINNSLTRNVSDFEIMFWI